MRLSGAFCVTMTDSAATRSPHPRCVLTRSVSNSYLQKCGVTRQQYDSRAHAREQAKAEKDRLLKSKSSGLTASDKHAIQTGFIYTWGRNLFICDDCWLLPEYCVCQQLQRCTPRTRVILHLHHNEWARVSNTGCMVQRSLSNSQMLLKGHAPHDLEFKRLCLEDPTTIVAILWPSEDALTPAQVLDLARSRKTAAAQGEHLTRVTTAESAQDQSLANANEADAGLVPDLLRTEDQHHEQGNLILVAVDANWSCARRMLKWYTDVLGDRFVKMSLPSGDVFPAGQEESILAPVRRACTAEAVAAALRRLEDPATEAAQQPADIVLSNLRTKVNAVLRQNAMVAQDDYDSVTRTWQWRGEAHSGEGSSDCDD